MYLTQYLHRALQQHPEKVAVCFGSRQRTFREFADRVARLAGALQRIGMGDGDRVAMLALNSDRYLEYQMAVPWGGGVLNPCNTRWSVPELVYALEDSGTAILLVDDAFVAAAGQLLRDAACLRQVVYCGEGEAPAGMLDYETLVRETAPVDDAARRGEDLMGIFYTGGTTGFPKGVMCSHIGGGIAALSLLSMGLAETGDTYLHAAPMFHVADFGAALPHWIVGNTHAIIPGFQPQAVLKAIEAHRVTNTLLVPTMIQMVVDHPAIHGGYDLRSLKTIAYGASPISEPVLDRAQKVLPGVGLVQLYGMTEIGPLTVNPPDYRPGMLPLAAKLTAAGRTSNCVELKIVDAHGREVPRGTVGEIVVRGDTLMQGYWNKPEQTAEAIRNGWYYTGDGGYLDEDGYLFIADRVKDMIVSGGENVYSAEVENAISKHRAVAACAVIAIPHAQWGEAVHAAVVLAPGQTLSAAELIAHCKTLIAGYKCPVSVAFVDDLPISGAGKVLKTRLREPYWKDVKHGIA
ncbi:long-chain-fatty-acid--CoA ligase [Paraburkholderia oxyphila]|uniref:long-chain-fatty-acid--CoA ligase n=1 Tax=Paraburkholderia oxyphila TaxID=614212 RepID=UPI000486B83B|nr:long-chain-fatty-acid--CoA ligase [Paraburkholderia oxyphila]